jgi:hypothetical protein
MARRVVLSVLALLVPLALLSCTGGDDTEMRMKCHQQGLQLGGSEVCTSWINTLEGQGHAQFFSSSVLPSSVVTIHVQAKAWLARGGVGIQYTDRDGKQQLVSVKPGEPSSFEANLRAEATKDTKGFFLHYSPARADSARADGLVLELTFRQANFNLPGG